MNLFREKRPLQFWDTAGPSRRDALITLMKTLELLAESLPLALSAIGSQSVEVQENFWRAFHEFDRRTDITEVAKNHDGVEYGLAMGLALEDWREIVECRVTQPKGPLAGGEINRAGAS